MHYFLRKRISGETLDLYIIILLLLILPLFVVDILKSYTWMIYCIIFYVYFGLIPYWTKGFTMGGYLLGIRVIFFTKNITPIKFILRIIQQYFLRFKRNYIINSQGQTQVDLKYNSNIILINKKIIFNKELQIYIFNIKKDNLNFYINRCIKRIVNFASFIFYTIIIIYISYFFIAKYLEGN